MAKPGKRAPINLIEVEKLAALHVTDQEMAGWFEVNVRTIERRKKNRKFAAAIERGRAKGKISIRRLQMRMLEQGNSTMGVWLGKQILGQNDYPHPLVTAVNSVLVLPSSIHAGQVGMGMTESIEVEQDPSGADLIDGRLQPTVDLASCPSHNIISVEPSDNHETESDCAYDYGRTANRVEQVGAVAHVACW